MNATATACTILPPRTVMLCAALVLSAVALSGSPAHAQMHSAHQPSPTAESAKPPTTDAYDAAVFPDLAGHEVQGTVINYFVLLDQLEWQDAEGSAQNWDAKAWIGTDLDRAWFRTEGEREDGRTDAVFAEALYGRSISPWWDLIAGVRQDFRPGPSRTWGAIGVQGLAPYQFAIEATAYIGESGRSHARFEVEYELLLSNRLILQPQLEAEVFAENDRRRRIGAGLSTVELGLRLRYEVRQNSRPTSAWSGAANSAIPPISPAPMASASKTPGWWPAFASGSETRKTTMNSRRDRHDDGGHRDNDDGRQRR